MDDKTPEEWKQLATILAISDPRSVAFDIAKRSVGDAIQAETAKVRAYATPNTGKHYGTEIVIDNCNGEPGKSLAFRVWLPVGDPASGPAKDDEDVDWCHYESAFEAEVVGCIIDAINEKWESK